VYTQKDGILVRLTLQPFLASRDLVRGNFCSFFEQGLGPRLLLFFLRTRAWSEATSILLAGPATLVKNLGSCSWTSPPPVSSWNGCSASLSGMTTIDPVEVVLCRPTPPPGGRPKQSGRPYDTRRGLNRGLISNTASTGLSRDHDGRVGNKAIEDSTSMMYYYQHGQLFRRLLLRHFQMVPR
jgi:hypothetical protein